MDLKSGDLLWPSLSGPPPCHAALREDIKCDVVIPGAGLSGAMVAHALSQAGLGVVVLDKRDVARGRPRGDFIATTMDLLTTGVNVPCVQNIVFFRYVRSPILFHQMVGRGTRLEGEKLMFRIYDYTGVTALYGADFVTPPTGGGDGGEPPPASLPSCPQRRNCARRCKRACPKSSASLPPCCGRHSPGNDNQYQRPAGMILLSLQLSLFQRKDGCLTS